MHRWIHEFRPGDCAMISGALLKVIEANNFRVVAEINGQAIVLDLSTRQQVGNAWIQIYSYKRGRVKLLIEAPEHLAVVRIERKPAKSI